MPANELDKIKNACALIEAKGMRGTGYLVAADLMVTCNHVVKSVADKTEEIDINFEHGKYTGSVINRDVINDCAVIKLDKPVNIDEIEPLRFSQNESNRNDEWEAYGFPKVTGKAGHLLPGYIKDPKAEAPWDAEGIKSISLYSDEIAAGQGTPAHGFSGSPVLVKGFVIGHLKKMIEDKLTRRAEMGTLYATPAKAILSLLPANFNQNNVLMSQPFGRSYLEIQDGDNLITTIFKESFNVNFTVSDSFLHRLRNDAGIMKEVVNEIEKLRGNHYTTEKDFFNDLEEVLSPLDQKYGSYDKPSVFKSHKFHIMKYASFDVFDKEREWLKNNSPIDGFFTKAGNNYEEWLKHKYDKIKILNMTRSIKLFDIYIAPNVFEKITSKQIVSKKVLEKRFNSVQGFCNINADGAKEGIKSLKEKENFIVVGKPGAGKTTFLRRITIEATKDVLTDKRVPCLVGLKEFADSKEPLLQFIIYQFNNCEFVKPEPFIQYLLKEGKCLLLLDGFDEVGKDDEARVINEVEKFIETYWKNQFVFSWRIGSDLYNFVIFDEVEMADFDELQIQKFINGWFKNDSEEAKKAKLCRDALNNYPRIRELASIPLLLSLICITVGQSEDFPKSRAGLYQQAINTLFKDWDKNKKVERQDEYEEFIKHREAMVNKIAYDTFKREELYLSQTMLENSIVDYLANHININKCEIDGNGILKSIENRTGIFVERAQNIYSFSHLTFQEYFTANYIAKLQTDNAITEFIDDYISDVRWREVFLLTAGLLLPTSDDFLLKIKERTDRLATHLLSSYFEKIFSNNILTSCIKTHFPSIENNDLLSRVVKFLFVIELELFIAEDRVKARDPKLANKLPMHLENCREKALKIVEGCCLIFETPLHPDKLFKKSANKIRRFAKIFNKYLCFPTDHPRYQYAAGLARELDWAVNIDRTRIVRKRRNDKENRLERDLKNAIDFFENLNEYLYFSLLLVDCLREAYDSCSNKTEQRILTELFTVLSQADK